MSLLTVLGLWAAASFPVVGVLSLLARAGHHEDVAMGYAVD